MLPYLKERLRNNTKYLYEIQGYRDKKNGKVKHKERCLGRVDEDGFLITKKKKTSRPSCKGQEGHHEI